MIHNYLESLQKGLDKNRNEFLQLNSISNDQLQAIHAEKRFTEFVSKAELKKFEMKGYERMLARILEAPLQSSANNNNDDLKKKLLTIKNQLFSQPAIEDQDDGSSIANKMRTFPKNFMESQVDHLE
jgi:hypothetical protein